MAKNRTINTLFMLMSVDGKISTGATDKLDFDKDLPKIKGVKEGLKQYYDIERTTDLFSFNTGRVMAKIGVNTRKEKPKKMPVTFVIVDNKPHLTEEGIKYLSAWTKQLILVTTNNSHPVTKVKEENVKVIYYPKEIDFQDLFFRLKSEYQAEYVTIQSGGEMNAVLVRSGLIDYLSVVIAPVIVGGKDTATLIDGKSFLQEQELRQLKSLKLEYAKPLEHSYLHLVYKVAN